MSVAAAAAPRFQAHEGASNDAEIRKVSELSPAELAAWQELADAASPYTVFQHPAYAKTFADTRILFIRRGGRLRLALPFIIKKSIGGTRTLCLPGAPITQYDDVPVAPGEDAAALMQEAFAALAHVGIDAIKLERVPETSAFFAHAPVTEARMNEQHAPILPLIGLTAPDPRGNAAVKKLQRKRRKLEELGTLAYHSMAAGEAPAEWIDRAIALKQEWLAERGDTSRLFANPAALSAFRSLFAETGASGHVFALTMDGEPIAIHLVFCTGKSQHQHFTVYDPAYFKHSPSALLTFFQIEWSIARGFELFDLMPPAFDYKNDWCLDKIGVYDVFLPLSLKGRLSPDSLFLKVKPALRRVFYVLPEGMRRTLLSRLGT